MQSEPRATDVDGETDRWALIRDIAVLQVKLIVDGLRDLILVPVSLVAGLISLFKAGDPSGNEFYRLLRIGRKSERWINLFGAAENMVAPDNERDHFPDEDIDTLVNRVESFVVDEYRKGGVTRQAKEHLDQLLGSIERKRRRRRSKESRRQ
jgi:hypothetical protein